jgi:tetratricopeptide (TPR) repeat protein
MNTIRKKSEWKNTFSQMVEGALLFSIGLVEHNINTPHIVRPHLDSIISQLDWGIRLVPQGAARLMVAIHPWPIRWERMSMWHQQLELVLSLLDAHDPLYGQIQACLADIFQISGQSQKVLENVERVFSNPSLSSNEFALLVNLAGGAWLSSLMSLGKTKEAECVAENLIAQLTSHALQIDVCRRLEAHSIILLQQSVLARNKGDISLALRLISQAIEILESRVDINRGAMSEFIQTRAIYHWVAMNYKAALDDLEYAQKLCVDVNNFLGLSSVRANRGLIYWSMSEYEKAEWELREAIQLSEKNKSIFLLMRQTGNLGMIYFNRGDIPKAILYIEREIELAKIANDEYEKTLGEGNKAAALIYSDQAEHALPGLFLALKKYIGAERFETLVGTLIDLSICHYRIGKLEESAHFAQRAYRLAEEKKNPSLTLIAMRARALSLPKDEAFELLTRALEIAEEHERKLDAAGCKLFMSYLAKTPNAKIRLWKDAVAILKKIGASKWVENKKLGDPVVVAITV